MLFVLTLSQDPLKPSIVQQKACEYKTPFSQSISPQHELCEGATLNY
jgi:hypothetical protein